MIDLGSKIVGGKELRYGFTTGTCATAAAKAATLMLLNNSKLLSVKVTTNSGKEIKLPVEEITIEENSVKCAIQKDSGDDPDVTNGMFVFAEVKFIDKGIIIKAGEGVGRVTKKGLAVPPGEPAVNPGPKKMIFSEIEKILPSNKGVEITFSIPGGKEVAKHTFNPRLGIEGGLSILGTTGIIEPMSVEAIKETTNIELNQILSEGHRNIIIVPGNYGSDYVNDILKITSMPILKVSNYIGDILMYAKNKSVENVLLVGHIGKLIKLAGGIFNTHSRVADGRMEIFSALAASEGLSMERVERILSANTTDTAIEIIEEEFNPEKQKKLYRKIAERATDKINHYIRDAFKVGTVIFTLQKGELGKCKTGNEILKEFS